MFRFYKSLPSLHGLIRTNIQQTSPFRTFTCTATNLKFSLTPDSDVILLSSNGSEKKMKYSEVLEKVGTRKLVRITKTKKDVRSTELIFQIMSEQDLEIATRKEKAIPSTYLGSRTNFGEDSS